MKITAYPLERPKCEMRPAPLQRDWMEQTPQRFAYRCLPLNIANRYGWEILCPSSFDLEWNGTAAEDAVTVTPLESGDMVAMSHFGSGIVSFFPGYIFRTDPGWDLFVMGPHNHPKAHIYPYSGIIETDWSVYGFTMNWQMMTPHVKVRFEAGEPFCVIFPIQRGALEQAEPEIRILEPDSETAQKYNQWLNQRNQVIENRKKNQFDGWEMNYMKGQFPDGTGKFPEHRTKLVIKPFKRVDQEQIAAHHAAQEKAAAPESAEKSHKKEGQDGNQANPSPKKSDQV